MTPRRRERIAHNETRFRSINDERDGASAGFVCECGDLSCAALVHVPLDLYEEVRSNPRRFVVRPGHELLDAEHVVHRDRRFAVVEKHADLVDA